MKETKTEISVLFVYKYMKDDLIKTKAIKQTCSSVNVKMVNFARTVFPSTWQRVQSKSISRGKDIMAEETNLNGDNYEASH